MDPLILVRRAAAIALRPTVRATRDRGAARAGEVRAHGSVVVRVGPASPQDGVAEGAGMAGMRGSSEVLVMYDDEGDPTAPVARACHIELVEEIPTGHATPLALELTTIDALDAGGRRDDHIELPALAPLAFGAPLTRLAVEPCGAPPFHDGTDHLGALLDLVAARAAFALERCSNEREHLVHGCGCSCHAGEDPAPPLAATSQADAIAARVAASQAAGIALPLVELARELELSELAMHVVVAVLAPRLRNEIARLYRALADQPGDPVFDDALLVAVLAGDDARLGDRVCAELADAGALVRYGLVIRDRRGGLDVDGALLARLRGQPQLRSAATTIRSADRALDELAVDRTVLRALVMELAAPRDPEQPVRVVMRGRRGSGRHAVIAALAARVDRRIACIDACQLPHGPTRAAVLRRELARAVIACAIPVISGIDVRDGDDPAIAAAVAAVLRGHPGPLVVRTTEGAGVPLESGHIDVVLAPLSEHDRRQAFAAALGRHAIAANAELLASHHRIAPGAIARVVAEARRRLDRGDQEPTALVDAVAREHVAARASKSAVRVPRLATWDQVAYPDATLDSLRELIARARHGKTVFDEWGYYQLAPVRGLTALFHGVSGTGKATAASLVARELGLELYRVDLARLLSRTGAENAIAELFDAAEDGGFLLLLDGVEPWFASRFDASSDAPTGGRDVDYLLARLDAFEGLAILTCQLEDSIDDRLEIGRIEAALRRRPALRLHFAFPDAELRARLWEAHLAPELPTAGDLDFAALARFPLSGASIRNSALRAAFLAAHDQSPVTQAHFERAAALEVREVNTLADRHRRR